MEKQKKAAKQIEIDISRRRDDSKGAGKFIPSSRLLALESLRCDD